MKPKPAIAPAATSRRSSRRSRSGQWGDPEQCGFARSSQSSTRSPRARRTSGPPVFMIERFSFERLRAALLFLAIATPRA
jgi:hypothetical protein